ncbi:MAG: 50S ribosomal protein L32 [Nitrospirae bacterium]|nr:50S ribosomal protein L32 [Nitrospirota bacterium]
MPNPKHRHSKSRRDMRRAQWRRKKSAGPNLSACPQCHELKPPHQVCLNCGTYKGTAVIAVEES